MLSNLERKPKLNVKSLHMIITSSAYINRHQIHLSYCQVCDIPSEDLLSHFTRTISFISSGQENGVVLVHCYHGKSRSAAVVTAYLMNKHKLGVERALEMLRRKRKCVQPNPGFMAQLRLWEAMRWRLDPSFLRYKMYRLHTVSEKMRKSKILSRESTHSVVDSDPALERGSCRNSAVIYKCKV